MIDLTTKNLKPYKLIERVASQRFPYHLAVCEQDSCLAMVEISEDAPEQFDYSVAFSESWADPGKMHMLPLPFVMMTSAVALAFMPNENSRMVIAGLGAGLVHTFCQIKLRERWDKQHKPSILSIEPDRSVIHLAHKYWGFDGDVKVDTIEEYLLVTAEYYSIDFLYINSFLAYHSHSPMNLFDDYEYMDMVFSRMTDQGVILINCFNYGIEPNTTRMDTYAKSRGLEMDVLNIKPMQSSIIHKMVLMGKSVIPPDTDTSHTSTVNRE